MATHIALASLSHTLENILLHPHPSNIIIPRKHMMFLCGKVDFLVNFFGTYSSRRRKEIADLEMMIVDVANEAKNIIESNVVSQIGRSRKTRKKYSNHLYIATQTVVEKLLFFVEELLQIEAKKGKVTAYASLVSLTHILHQILHPPPLNRIVVDRQQIELLQNKVNVLIDFLETYDLSRSSREILDLEMKIADAVYEADDIIESNVMDQIRATSGENISASLCEGIERVLKKFLDIEKELSKIKNKEGDMEELHSKSHTTTTSRRPLHDGEITMVGLKEHSIQIIEALDAANSNQQSITITGMGGIGKTTLAFAVYNNRFVIERFYLRAWVTVSNEYTVKELLLRLLSQISKVDPHIKEKTVEELGLQLYKELFDRIYLIVLDDMWHIHVWENLKKFLPNNYNGSRILVTTRLSNLAMDFGSNPPYKLDFLDEEQSWDLLRDKIFGKEDCPVELEEIGKHIAKRCSGLPLTIVVISGLLANSRTRKHWEDVAEDITSALMGGHDEHLDLLFLSYSHLPMYLKPCFLYLAMFPEDFEIRVSRLVRLWVAEGLIKNTQAKSFEEVAREYLEDLISRNLILVHKVGSGGKVKYCKIHDLIRELCISEAQKERFLYIANLENPNISANIETVRCLSISAPNKPPKMTAIEALRSAKFCRSWSCLRQLSRDYDPFGFNIASPEEVEINGVLDGFRLMKVVDDCENYIDISKLNNLRYVRVSNSFHGFRLIYRCWNLQTLDSFEEYLPPIIWDMPQLRHLLMMRGVALPDPPNDQNLIVLENLQTLGTINNFKCTEQVLKRIPNLKKLRLRCYYAGYEVGSCRLKKLVRLEKLESLGIEGDKKIWKDMAFPISLKKLSFRGCRIPWEEFSAVGSLPNLEVLKCFDATKGEEWNPIEGSFPRLKFLMISESDLKIWGAEKDHFPCLETLVLTSVGLNEIPMSFAEILTLQAIKLGGVNSSLWTSANQVSYEREQLGYGPLQIAKF